MAQIHHYMYAWQTVAYNMPIRILPQIKGAVVDESPMTSRGSYKSVGSCLDRWEIIVQNEQNQPNEVSKANNHMIDGFRFPDELETDS